MTSSGGNHEAIHIAQVLERDGLYVLHDFLRPGEIETIAADGLRLYMERPAFARVSLTNCLPRRG